MRLFRELLKNEETKPTDICLHPLADIKIREFKLIPGPRLLTACQIALKHLQNIPSATPIEEEVIKMLREAIENAE